MSLKLGKKPASPLRSGTPLMSELLRSTALALPPIPLKFGHGYDFGRSNWLMLGNGPCDDNTVPSSWYAYDGAGNCAWAGPGHEEMEDAFNAHRPVPKFTCLNILNQYAAYLGVGSARDLNASNDQGSDVQEVLTWRRNTGLVDVTGNVYKIGPYVALTPGNLNELWAATYLFENAGVGVTFQQAQMDQFNAGQAWKYVAGSPTEGGHYVPVMGNNGLISWSRRVGFSKSWYTNLCDEAYCYIDPERYNRVTGQTLEKYDDADLEQFLTLVAHAKGVRVKRSVFSLFRRNK